MMYPLSPPPSSSSPDPDLMPVVVSVRLKPGQSGQKPVISVNPEGNALVWTGRKQVEDEQGVLNSTYNYVFSESSQEFVYDTVLRQFVDMILVGYDVTVLSFGQAQSGKTYTLFRPSDSPIVTSEEDYGVCFRLVRDVFQRLQQAQEEEGADFDTWASFLDIDETDEVQDFLSHDDNNSQDEDEKDNFPAPSKVKIKEVLDGYTGRSRCKVEGVSMIQCSEVEDVFNCLNSGLAFQQMKVETSNEWLMNASAGNNTGGSHSVFSLHVRQTCFEEMTNLRRTTESTIRFVDLASSDLLDKGQNIGLLALNNVVSSLGDSRLNVMHEPQYKDSILTHLLKDSLGGTALTVMICCVSPLAEDVRETEVALQFVSRMANIKNNPIPRVSKLPLNGQSRQRSDSDTSQIRSASRNKGKLPNIPFDLSRTENASPESFSGNEQPNLVFPQVDPLFMYNYHSQQTKLLGEQLAQQGLLMHPNRFGFPVTLPTPQELLNPYLNFYHPPYPIPMINPNVFNGPENYPATMPVNLNSAQLAVNEEPVENNNRNDEEDKKLFSKQKLARIAEESEHSSNLESSHNANNLSSSEENINSECSDISDEEEEEVTQKYEEDKECDNNNEEEEEKESEENEDAQDLLLSDPKIQSLLKQFKDETDMLVQNFEKQINLTEFLPVSKVSQASASVAEPMQRVAASVPDTPHDLSPLYKVKEAICSERQRLERRNEIVSREGSQEQYRSVQEQREEMDTIIDIIDEAIDVRSAINRHRVDFKLERDYLSQGHLDNLMSTLTLDECKLNLLSLTSRVMDLRIQGVNRDDEMKELDHLVKFYKVNQKRLTEHFKKSKSRYKKEIYLLQGENERKQQIMEKRLAELEEENLSIREKNALLTKFYRNHMSGKCSNCGHSPGTPEAKGSRHRNTVEIKDQKIIVHKQ